MNNGKRKRAITFCGACCIVYVPRRKWCGCGTPTTESHAPAELTCDHCGDVAIESSSGLFSEDDGDACASCGFPGHVNVDDNTAYWSSSDDDLARCSNKECTECAEWVAKLGKGLPEATCE